MGNMRLVSLIVVTVFFAGCASGRVQVVDPDGRPVQGAKVVPVSLSTNGAAATTDAKGRASVPLIIGQATKWVSISRAGFTSRQVDVPAKWPLKVVLQPVTGQ
jgi:hypothetical protein